jgi:GT2 family glycosyltransferase
MVRGALRFSASVTRSEGDAMTRLRFIVVVLNYRRAKETLDFLASLAGSTIQPLRTIVVDNDSGDNSVRDIRAAYPDLEVIETGSNSGFAGGMNAGIRQALAMDSTYIFAVNSDALLAPDALDKLIQALDIHPAAGAATGTFYYYPEMHRVWYAGGRLAYWRASALTGRRVDPGSQGSSAEVRDVTFLTGNAILFRSAALQKVGLFDERYFMYYEDVDLCARMIAGGFALLYVPPANFYHRMEVDEQTPFKTYYVFRNRLLFLASAPSLLVRAVGTVTYAGVLLIKSATWCIHDRSRARAAWMGLHDFLRSHLYAGRGFSLNTTDHHARGGHADRD